MPTERMRVLVTGAEGFVARHLIPLLQHQGAEVVGTVFGSAQPAVPLTRVRTLDITSEKPVRDLVSAVAPTHLVHLAAVSSVHDSFTEPGLTKKVNLQGTQQLLEAAAALPTPPLALIIGSGDEYGQNDGTPLRELTVAELKPVSPYGESKKAVEELIEGNAVFKKFTIRTRSFPSIGPGQAQQFFLPGVAAQIVRIERGQQRPVIGVGNLSAVRDLTDVRDVVRVYALLLKQGTRGEVYNVCSGRGIAMGELLKQLVALSRISIRVEQDPEKVRPVDIPVLIGDNTKLTKATGWVPEIPLEKTLRDVLEYARGLPT